MTDNVRIEKTEHFHATQSAWLINHGWEPLKLSALPRNTFVLSNGTEDCYCCSLYETDSDFAFLAFPVSNKGVKRPENGLEELFKEIEKYAKSKGYSLLFTTSNTPAVEDSLKNCGWGLGDIGVNQYTKQF